MEEPLAQNLNERERLLLMAAYLHGPGPEEELARANCWRVLREAMRWGGVLDEQVEATGGQCDHPVVEEWYTVLIGMIDREWLLRGAGNLGGEEGQAAWPAYTGCGVTEEGRDLAERLWAEHPERGV